MQDLVQISGTVVPLFVVIAIGALVRSRGVLTEKADRTLLDLIVHLLLPCLIFDHVVGSSALRQWKNLAWGPLLGFSCTTVGIGMAYLMARLSRKAEDSEVRTFAFSAGVFNYAYIPIPLVEVLYGQNALAVLFLFNLGCETAFWTVGLGTLERRPLLKDWSRALTSPVRAILLGVAVNFSTAAFGLQLDELSLSHRAWGFIPDLILATVHLIGVCAIPLALLLIGATMADFWRESRFLSGGLTMGAAIFVRNLLLPVGFILLAWVLPISRELKETLVVQAAMPAGIFSLLLVRHNSGNVTTALQVIFSTWLVAIFTLPLWMRIGMAVISSP